MAQEPASYALGTAPRVATCKPPTKPHRLKPKSIQTHVTYLLSGLSRLPPSSYKTLNSHFIPKMMTLIRDSIRICCWASRTPSLHSRPPQISEGFRAEVALSSEPFCRWVSLRGVSNVRGRRVQNLPGCATRQLRLKQCESTCTASKEACVARHAACAAPFYRSHVELPQNLAQSQVSVLSLWLEVALLPSGSTIALLRGMSWNFRSALEVCSNHSSSALRYPQPRSRRLRKKR